jgi:beta-phosphoglucomutase
LNLILHWGNVIIRDEEEKKIMADKKNEWYLEFITRMTPDEILPGVESFINDVRNRRIKTVIGSASKNARLILEKIGLLDKFDAIIDGNSTAKSKPDPEVFLLGAQAVNANPQQCIVFEDAEKGIQAALNGGFYAVGVGQHDILDEAHIVIPSFEYIEYDEVLEALAASTGSIK